MIPGLCEASRSETLPTLRPSAGPLRDEHPVRRRILAALLRQMPTTGHKLEIEVDPIARSLVLSGVVRTFHTKQVVFHSCQRLAMEYDVVDALTVDEGVSPPCWRKMPTLPR